MMRNVYWSRVCLSVCLCVCVCLYVCVSVCGRISTLLHRPGCNLGNGKGCPLVVHYWADLQSGFVTMTTCKHKMSVSACTHSVPGFP